MINVPIEIIDLSLKVLDRAMAHSTSKFRTRALKGYPDFSLWYGEPDRVETNLVIVKAKSGDLIGLLKAQQLALMCE